MSGFGRVEDAVSAVVVVQALGDRLAVIRKNGVISGDYALRGWITFPGFGGIRGHGGCSRAAGGNRLAQAKFRASALIGPSARATFRG
jgi:hypothetical protein